jgi:hypothetical protein
MKTSEDWQTLLAAVAAARPKFGAVVKLNKNTHLGNHYASLTEVLGAVQGPLHDQGVEIIQGAAIVDGQWSWQTRLAHVESGEWVEVDYPLMPDDGKGRGDAQAIGSAATYARRHSLLGILGLVAEDDDGQAQAGRPQAGPQQQATRPQTGAAQQREGKASTQVQPEGAVRLTELARAAGALGTDARDAVSWYLAAKGACKASAVAAAEWCRQFGADRWREVVSSMGRKLAQRIENAKRIDDGKGLAYLESLGGWVKEQGQAGLQGPPAKWSRAAVWGVALAVAARVEDEEEVRAQRAETADARRRGAR